MNKAHFFCALLLSATLAACGGGGSTSTMPAPPTASLSVDHATVASGGSALLTWTSTGASACHALGGWSGDLATSGTQSTGPLTAPATYSITCTSASASSTESSITVNLTPTTTLTATPTNVASGGTSTLIWSSSNAATCSATGGWTGAQPTGGTFTTAPLSATTTYSLVCSGAGGDSVAASATVAIASVQATSPTVTLTATPTSVASGGTSTLTWSSSNTTACAATGAWSGAQATSGAFSIAALSATSTYTLTCTGTAGGATAQATVTVTGSTATAPTVALTAAPPAVTSGGASTLTWSSSNATTCTASGAWTGSQPTAGTGTTAALSAPQTYTLTCTGAGGSTSAAATVAIVTGTLSPQTAALVVGQTKGFTSSLAGNVAVFSVDSVTGGNATVGTVSATGLYTAGTATGAHTILAVSTADATQSQSAKAIVTDLNAVSTYHQDNTRSGANTHEFALTPASVAPATFGKLASCTVDGAVVAQPLWVASLTVGGAPHNVVYVATMHDSLYALDADAGACVFLWQASLADVAHGAVAGETSVPASAVGKGTGDIEPEIGITGTPVIDMSTHILYAVSKTAIVNAGVTVLHSRLHAIDMITGLEKAGSPVEIAGTVPGLGTHGTMVAFDSHMQLQRSGLALANNTVYVAFSSHEDANPWFGWVFGYVYGAAGFIQASIINTVPNHNGGGIWMAGGAPAIDANGNVFVVTGNGQYGPADHSYGDSLLKFSSSLALSDYWTPMNQDVDNSTDHDFGSGGAAVLTDLPAGASYLHVMVCGGKDGALQVLNRDMLGSYAGPTVQTINTTHGMFSTPAFWNNQLYVGGAGSNLALYKLNTTTVQFAQSSVSQALFNWPGATPTISANGTTNGVAWALDTSAYCTPQSRACGPVVIHALDANNLASELWNSGTAAADSPGYAVKFAVPTVANGHVYVGTRGNNTGSVTSTIPGTLEIYGLKP